jgi:hypothetical protein
VKYSTSRLPSNVRKIYFYNLSKEKINPMKKHLIALTITLFVSLLFIPDCSKAELNINDENLYKSLRGKIILRVESKGEAYYVHPTKQKMFYLGRPADAFQVMREQGIGITNANLIKILPDAGAADQEQSDGDFLKDSLEDALGTDKYENDTDKDGFDDRQEILSGNNPLGSGNLKLDNSFAKEQAGKIFLQVENKGEAWYINPKDLKRYFLGRPSDAFYLMRNLGLGISEDNFKKLQNSDTYTLENLNVGDTIKGLSIVSIEPFSKTYIDGKLSPINYKITYDGSIEVNGKYSISKDFAPGTLFFYANSGELPTIQDESGTTFFTFTNQDYARTVLGDTDKEVKIRIKNYTDISYPAEISSTAEFLSIVK